MSRRKHHVYNPHWLGRNRQITLLLTSQTDLLVSSRITQKLPQNVKLGNQTQWRMLHRHRINVIELDNLAFGLQILMCMDMCTCVYTHRHTHIHSLTCTHMLATTCQWAASVFKLHFALINKFVYLPNMCGIKSVVKVVSSES